MRIHYLQHVPFEDLENIKDWTFSKGSDVMYAVLQGRAIAKGGRIGLAEMLAGQERFSDLVLYSETMLDSIEDEYRVKSDDCLMFAVLADVSHRP